MDLQQFFVDVKKEREKLEAMQKADPTGFVFVTSDYNREKNTTNGTVAEVTLQKAAEGIANRTMHVSTADELAAHKEREAANRKQIQLQEYASKQQVHLVLDRSGDLQAAPEAPHKPAK